MPLSAKKWKELKEGWGLEEVPAELRNQVACCMCGDDSAHERDKLYTDVGIPHNASIKKYRERLAQMAQNCFCRFHAEKTFGD